MIKCKNTLKFNMILFNNITESAINMSEHNYTIFANIYYIFSYVWNSTQFTTISTPIQN